MKSQVDIANKANLASKLSDAIQGHQEAEQAEDYKVLSGDFDKFVVEAEGKGLRDALHSFRKDIGNGIQIWAKQLMVSGLLRWRQHVLVNLFRKQQAAKFDKAGVFGSSTYSPVTDLKKNKGRRNDLMRSLKDAEDFWTAGGGAEKPERRTSPNGTEKRRSKPGSREGSDVRRKSKPMSDILENP